MENMTFQNLLGVLGYLRDRGYKASKSSLYLHAGHGKIHPRKDELFHVRDVEKYAKIFLKRRGGGPQRSRGGIDSLQKERLAADTMKLSAQALHWQTKTRVLTGAFVPRELFEMELAKRATVLKNDLESFARSQAPGIISMAEGVPEKAPDLIQWLLDSIEDFLARYGEEREFRVPAMPALLETTDDPEDLEAEDETASDGGSDNFE
jgi:hypothetical protein